MKRMLKHTCTIQVRSRGTATAATGGHGAITWSNYATAVPCLLQHRANLREGQNSEGTVIGDAVLFMGMQAVLLAENALEDYTVVDVRGYDGEILDAGPFKIEAVRDAGGQYHHLQVTVRRVPVGSLT